jgi:precorrin-6x reductase
MPGVTHGALIVASRYHWIKVDSMVDAVEFVGRFRRRAFLTIDAGEIARFASATGVRFLVRLVEPLRRTLAVAALRGRRRTRALHPGRGTSAV